MDNLEKQVVILAWVGLALIHLLPASVVIKPGLVETLYGVNPDGTTGGLLVHRGALFLAVCLVAIYAAFAIEARRAASLVIGVSLVGFLVVYLRAEMPEGALRKIAVTDLLGLPLLLFVTWNAWR